MSASSCCNVFAVKLGQSKNELNLYVKYGGTEN